MTTTDIQQAKEWAERMGKVGDLLPRPRAAVDVIKSLPDHWIDAKELQELKESLIDSVREMPGIAEQTTRDTIRELVYEYIEWIDDILPAPTLPTLADMTPEERGACLWMQVDLPRHLPGAVLTDPGGHGLEPRVMYQDGATFTVEPKDVTPLQGEPKLGWPGAGVEDAPAVDDEPVMMPRPEDVPAGEPWIVKFYGHEWVGTRDSRVETVCSWALARLDGADFTVSRDGEITLVSRLVPEVKP